MKMKWTTLQIEKLKTLCNEGKSNKEIAEAIGCDITAVYAKRSQLGITIDKCKPDEKPKREAAKINKDFEKAVAEMEQKNKIAPLTEAFNKLEDELLLKMANNGTSQNEMIVYATVASMVSALQDALRDALKTARNNN